MVYCLYQPYLNNPPKKEKMWLGRLNHTWLVDRGLLPRGTLLPEILRIIGEYYGIWVTPSVVREEGLHVQNVESYHASGMCTLTIRELPNRLVLDSPHSLFRVCTNGVYFRMRDAIPIAFRPAKDECCPVYGHETKAMILLSTDGFIYLTDKRNEQERIRDCIPAVSFSYTAASCNKSFSDMEDIKNLFE